jgi:hypothetical protein
MGRPGTGPAHTLEELELARLRLLRNAAIGAGVIACVVLLMYARGTSQVAAAMLFATGALIVWLVTWSIFEGICDKFKKTVLPSLVANVAPGLTYQADGAIGENEFRKSDLFETPDRYRGTDLFEGLVGATSVRFGLVDAEERYTETSTDSSGKREVKEKFRDIFKGMFFVADFAPARGCKTLVGPAGMFFRTGVDLQDPAFSRLFKVTSDIEAEVRTLLAPALRESLVALHGRVGDFRASFCLGRIFIAVPMSLNTFKPGMLTPLTDPVQIEEIQATLRSMIAVVGDLPLAEAGQEQTAAADPQ